ncbi:hypothetical protein [Planktotalea sp.]|uniref:hypothetical protein n=1 Tax=Planktotalea sp. TaxID=2029877 RepID=UPI003D6B984E
MKTIWVFLMWLFAAPLAAQVPSISGQDVPEFREAVETWLAGDDLAALQSLSTLSHTGNTAAQILLARIAHRPHSFSHVVKDLPRKDRIALLRQPGGLSGKSWMIEAAKTDQLAKAFIGATQVGAKAASLSTLISYDEKREMLEAAESLLGENTRGELLTVIMSPEFVFPPEGDRLLRSLYTFIRQDKPVDLEAMAWVALELGKAARQKGARFEFLVPAVRDDGWHSELVDAALAAHSDVRSWTPIRALCEKAQSKHIGKCTLTGMNVVNLVDAGAMESPVIALVSNNEYWSSARFEADLARLLPDLKRMGAIYADFDVEFAAALVPLQDKFGHSDLWR